MKRLLFVGVLVAFGVTLGVACAGSNGGSKALPTASVPTPTSVPEVGVRAGNFAPDFTIEEAVNWTESPLPFKLSDLRGRVILLNFWASWCPPCKREMPSLEAVYNRYKAEGFLVLGINLKESRATVEKFMDSLNLTFPSVLDDGTIEKRYGGVRSIPTTFIIDRKGVVRTVQIGERDWDSFQVQSYLEFLLSEEP